MIKVDFAPDMRAFAQAIQANIHGLMANLPQLVIDVARPRIIEAIRVAMKEQPEYQSLVAGRLRSEFGFNDGGARVNEVIESVLSAVIIEPIPPGQGDIGGVFVGAFRVDVEDALSSIGASYTSTGGQVDWLSWLLKSGDSVVVSKFRIARKDSPNASERINKVIERVSRSKESIMLKSKTRDYQVPRDGIAAGTETDNWMSRAAAHAEPQVVEILLQAARGVTGGI